MEAAYWAGQSSKLRRNLKPYWRWTRLERAAGRSCRLADSPWIEEAQRGRGWTEPEGERTCRVAFANHSQGFADLEGAET